MDNLLTLFDLPEPAPLSPVANKLRRILVELSTAFWHAWLMMRKAEWNE